MVVHNPVVNIPAEKNDKFPVLPRKTFRANGKPSETLERFARTPNFFYLIWKKLGGGLWNALAPNRAPSL